MSTTPEPSKPYKLKGSKYIIYHEHDPMLEEVRRLGGLPTLGAAANFVLKMFGQQAIDLLRQECTSSRKTIRFSQWGFNFTLTIEAPEGAEVPASLTPDVLPFFPAAPTEPTQVQPERNGNGGRNASFPPSLIDETMVAESTATKNDEMMRSILYGE